PCTCPASCPGRSARRGWQQRAPPCRYTSWTHCRSGCASASACSLLPGAQDGQAAGAGAAGASRWGAGLGSYFALDSPDYLQAGGRLEPPGVAAGHHGGGPELPGGRRVLTSRPLLHVRGGRITVLERVRTRSAAAARLAELAAEFAPGRPVDLAIQHLGNAERAAELSRRLAAAIPAAPTSRVAEAGAAILAHTGPGMLG